MHLIHDIKKRNLVYKGGHVPYNGALIERARDMRRKPTKEELILWNSYLRNHQLKFIRQKVIDHYIVDFYCPSKQLAIEIDGGIHKTKFLYDKERTNILSLYGVKVIRIKNKDVLHDLGCVIKRIEQHLNKALIARGN